MFDLLDRILSVVCAAYTRVSQALLALLVLSIFAEVLMRYFLGSAILGSGEFTKLALTWIVFLMAAVLHRRRRHIVVTALVDLMDAQARRYVEMMINVAVIVLAAFVTLQLYRVWPFLRLETPVFSIPDTAFKIAPLFAFVPIALQCVVNLARGARVEQTPGPTI